MTFMGLATSYSGLMAARWFLGLAEAGLFPGINYYLSCCMSLNTDPHWDLSLMSKQGIRGLSLVLGL
jgi:hypothetical protein